MIEYRNSKTLYGISHTCAFREILIQMSFNVYVINLDLSILDVRKFRNANPNYKEGKPCVYVGQTAKTPEERYLQHKEGGMLSNTYVLKYGNRLRPKNYEKFNPLETRAAAEKMEKELAEKLQKKGYGVWWA